MTIVGLLAGDIAFHAPWFYLWNKISKGGLWIISIALIAIISYGPIYDQYKKDKMPAGVVEIQQFGQELVNLSSDILSFTGDRNKNEPSLANASRDDIQKNLGRGSALPAGDSQSGRSAIWRAHLKGHGIAEEHGHRCSMDCPNINVIRAERACKMDGRYGGTAFKRKNRRSDKNWSRSAIMVEPLTPINLRGPPSAV
jgi:hypothetical protein